MLDAASYYKQQMMTSNYSNYIELYTGKRFYLDHPEFDIRDIAGALSKQCRFTGHTSRFYSVAEHSCLVALIMEEHDLGSPFEGLMHDAHEAYCSDLAAPWKVELPEYKTFEKRLETPLRAHFGLPPTLTEGCKKADWAALFVEANYLMPSKGVDWVCPDPSIRELAQTVIASFDDRGEYLGIDYDDAEQMFLEAYDYIPK